MTRKLSYSQINTYTTCGEKYRLHYIMGYREKWQRASLLFGSAIDNSLNNLLEKRNLEEAVAVFEKQWNFQFLNKKYTALMGNPDIVFGARDLDTDLISLTDEESAWLKEFEEYKKTKKWDQISLEDRTKYNTFCWTSLREKGLIILKSYYEKVLPKFISVTGIQHKSELTNADGDSVVQYLDFIVTLEDGSIVLMDNKTTSSLDYYSDDSPGKSQQLLSYFYTNQEAFKLGAVGYVAMCKQIVKNKTKKCSKCGVDGTESKARTCDAEYPGIVIKRKKEVEGMVRCNGEWDVTMHPEAAIKIIINVPKEKSVDLVLSTFDEANNGIKNQVYYKNLAVCDNQYGSPCPYRALCWEGSTEDLIKKESV